MHEIVRTAEACMNKGKQDQINGKQDRVRPLVYRPTVCSTAGLTQKKSLQEFLLFLAFTLQECFRTLECDATPEPRLVAYSAGGEDGCDGTSN